MKAFHSSVNRLAFFIKALVAQTLETTPICGAARPAPLAASMVSSRSLSNACSSGVLKAFTGCATRNRRSSPIFKMSRMAIVCFLY
jgi:hypothetical protein